MERVAAIIEADPAQRKAVVLSACRGVTDALLTLVTLAEQNDPALDDRLQELRQRHVGIAHALLGGELHVPAAAADWTRSSVPLAIDARGGVAVPVVAIPPVSTAPPPTAGRGGNPGTAGS